MKRENYSKKYDNKQNIEPEVIEETNIIEEDTNKVGKVIPELLNVRSEADPDAGIVTVLEQGEVIDILDETDEFYEIEIGYVMKQFIEVI